MPSPIQSQWIYKPPAGTRLDRSHPLSQQLLQMYAFNEGGGLTLREEVLPSTHNGAIQTGTTWGPGQKGIGLNFDANNAHYVNIGTHALGLTNPDVVSFECMFRTNSAASSQALYGVSNTASVMMIDLVATGVIRALINGTQICFSGNVITAGIDYHFAYVRRGTTPSGNNEIWINGVKVSTTNVTTGYADTSCQRYIGLRTGASEPFNGRIYKMSIYNRALFPSEIGSLYASPWQMFSQPRLRADYDTAAPSTRRRIFAVT